MILGSTLPIAGQTYTLSGSGVSSSASTIVLSSFSLPQNGYKIQDADLGDIFFLTLEPGNRSKQEIVSCTTSTQNINGTNSFTSCTRGLSPVSPYTASSTLQFAHAGGSQVIFSDPPQLFNLYTAKANNETIAGEWTYTINPHAGTATSSNQIITLGQANNLVNQGAATSTESNGGIVELGTIAEQASSFDGGALKPTVLQTKNSTSTCQVVGSYNIVASTTTGKLDKGCFDLTAAYTLSGQHTFTGGIVSTASSTLAATTTVLANSATNNALVLNGIAYAFPSSQPAFPAVLRTNGSGVLSWKADGPYTYATTTDSTVANASATTTTITIPAGVLTASSTISVRAAGVCVSTGSALCTFDVRTTGGIPLISGTVSSPTSGITERAMWNALIQSNNSTSAQVGTMNWSAINTGTVSGVSAGQVSSNEATTAINFSNSLTLFLVITANNAATFTLNNATIVVTP